MYNFVVREYLDLKEYRFYSSPIKTDEDRIKPRKKRSKRVEEKFAYVYKNPFTGEEIIEEIEFEENEKSVSSEYASYNRTRRVIYDLCMSNQWEYFVTFTFSKDTVDRYSYEECSKKMIYWINNVKKKFSPDLKYVVVPEQHKDGAWHFHGVFSDVGSLSFVDSGKKDKKGRVIYNLYEYKFGWTTATEITDNIATCLYIQKYISKDMCKTLANKKRYWCSRNLERPKEEKKMLRMDLEEFEKSIEMEDYKKRLIEGDYYNISQYLIYTTNAT